VRSTRIKLDMTPRFPVPANGFIQIAELQI
jgi:hypothetical protein